MFPYKMYIQNLTQDFPYRHNLAWEVLRYEDGFDHISFDHASATGAKATAEGGDRLYLAENTETVGAARLRVLPAFAARGYGTSGGTVAGAECATE